VTKINTILHQVSIHHADFRSDPELGNVETHLGFRFFTYEIDTASHITSVDRLFYDSHLRVQASNHINMGNNINTKGYTIDFCVMGIFSVDGRLPKETIKNFFLYDAVNHMIPHANHYLELFRDSLNYVDNLQFGARIFDDAINNLVASKEIDFIEDKKKSRQDKH